MKYKLDVVNRHNKNGYETVNRDTFWRDSQPTGKEREDLINTVMQERINRELAQNNKVTLEEVDNTKIVIISSTSVISLDGTVKPIYNKKVASSITEYADGTFVYDEATSQAFDEDYFNTNILHMGEETHELPE